MTRRIIGYARVSSEEQARGSSLGDQQSAIRVYAATLGGEVATFYVEAESAVHEKAERRIEILRLMADVRKGDLVLCDKLDRWSRDPEFTYGSVRKILAAGASFYAVSDRVDPSTSEGDTALGFRVLFAREEHKRIKERMVGTRKLLRNRGMYSEGSTPFGYRRQAAKGHKSETKNVLVIEPKEAEIVRSIFRRCIAGAPISKIATELGINRDLAVDTIHKRVYLGEIRNSDGQWIRARHEPIVDADLFDRANAALQSRNHVGGRPRDTPTETSDWMLRDIAVCGLCGARMSAAYAGEPGPHRRYYYKCARRCVTRFVPVRAAEAEASVAILLRLQELRAELANPPKASDHPPAVDSTVRRAALQRRRERFVEAFADDLMSKDDLRAALGKVDAEVSRLDASERAVPKPPALADSKVRREVLREIREISTAWEGSTQAERRKIAGHLATSAHLAAGQPVRMTWRTAEELAQEGSEQ